MQFIKLETNIPKGEAADFESGLSANFKYPFTTSSNRWLKTFVLVGSSILRVTE